MKIVRGQRILESLNEDSTYNKLYRNIQRTFPQTQKRQNAIGEVNIRNVEYVPYQANATLQVNAVATSNGNQYVTQVQIPTVTFQPEDTPNNITFKGADGEEHSILPVNLSRTNVKVRCTCLDFHFRFATWNYSDKSLIGAPPELYRRKTQNRPPANPLQTPGLCKHVIKLFDTLRRAGLVR